MSIPVAFAAEAARAYIAARIPGDDITESLGQGAYAMVFGLRNRPNQVVKVTTDFAEFSTAKAVQLAQSLGKAEALVKVQDYWTGFRKDFVGRATLVLLEERLEPLTQLQHEAWTYDIRNIAKGIVYPMLNTEKYDEKIRKFVPIDFADMRKPWLSAHALNLRNIYLSCQEAGIESYDDWHPGNVMNRPGYGMVISDLGMTSTPQYAITNLEAQLKTAKDGPIGAQVGR